MKIKCPSCARYCKYPNSFCTWCGKPLPQIYICKECGREVLEENSFCTYCGTPKDNNIQKSTVILEKSDVQSEEQVTEIQQPNSPQNLVQSIQTTEVEYVEVNGPPITRQTYQIHSSTNSFTNDVDSNVNKNCQSYEVNTPEKKQSRFFSRKNGRYNRSEFWWRALLNLIIFFIVFAILGSMGRNRAIYQMGAIVYGIITFIGWGFFFSFLFCMAKRIHDINYSAWYLVGYYIGVPSVASLMGLKSNAIWLCIFVIPFVALLLIPSYPETNKWGPPSE